MNLDELISKLEKARSEIGGSSGVYIGLNDTLVDISSNIYFGPKSQYDIREEICVIKVFE